MASYLWSTIVYPPVLALKARRPTEARPSRPAFAAAVVAMLASILRYTQQQGEAAGPDGKAITRLTEKVWMKALGSGRAQLAQESTRAAGLTVEYIDEAIIFIQGIIREGWPSTTTRDRVMLHVLSSNLLDQASKRLHTLPQLQMA